MKLILALSLCLMLPMHAMDREKNDPHTHLLAQATEASAQKIKNARRKKIAAGVFITLLTIGGVALNGVSAYTSSQSATYQALPYTDQLPLNNATCTYQATIATISPEESLPIANPFGSPEPTFEFEACYANQTQIPSKYCDCKTPPCKVILETCQENNPSKEQIVVSASMGAILTQLCAWTTYISTYGENN